jgi:hypothetical protein
MHSIIARDLDDVSRKVRQPALQKTCRMILRALLPIPYAGLFAATILISALPFVALRVVGIRYPSELYTILATAILLLVILAVLWLLTVIRKQAVARQMQIEPFILLGGFIVSIAGVLWLLPTGFQ